MCMCCIIDKYDIDPSNSIHADSIKHERELDGKSTAVHAKVIAEDDVDFYTWGEIPDFEQPERSLLLFPGPVSVVRWVYYHHVLTIMWIGCQAA